MTKARDLADFVSAGNPLADGTIDVADINGVTATTDEINILDGVTSTTSELNILDGVTATTAELNYTDGVTSNIQTQLDAKVDLAGDTMTGDLSFGDNNKAIFGAGSDLQIYHSGTNSFITEQGTGSLYISERASETDVLINDSREPLKASSSGSLPASIFFLFLISDLYFFSINSIAFFS